jgi:ATP-dependent exoDNAse (exonuclease V) beta subunit
VADASAKAEAHVRGEAEAHVRAEADAHVRALGFVVGPSVTETADRIGHEISQLLGRATVRDRKTGLARAAQPADIAVLFRTRDAHREFEKALERRGISTYVYKGLGFFDADEVQDAVSLLRFLADPTSDLRAAALLRTRLVRLSDRALSALAPHGLAASLASQGPSAAVETFTDEDRAVWNRLREELPLWLSWVDRLPPSDLLHRILARTGYTLETAGLGERQAHENLKKLGAIIRRFQNRGYATLARVADHLDELAVGDESNAAIDAEDSVSLMTIHAAKGLEFPIVFVANMHRGTGTQRAPIRVVAAATEDDDSVAVADYQSEADEDAVAKDREETKRLLYVALTRARDRLYLSASVADGVLRATRGSLAEVLPQSLRAVMTSAAVSTAGSVVWSDAEGREHVFDVGR